MPPKMVNPDKVAQPKLLITMEMASYAVIVLLCWFGRGYDADYILALIAQNEAKALIPAKKTA